MDMIGQGRVIDLFSKACHNEDFTKEELLKGNPARHNLIPLLDDSYTQGSSIHRQIAKPPPLQSTQDQSNPPPPVESTWAYFSFEASSLAALKSIASKTVKSSTGFVSTDDVLSAFIWKSVTRARLPRLDQKAETCFARAVNVRRFLGIPETYPGLAQNMTFHDFTVGDLVEESLGVVASNLRSALDPKTSELAYQTRALATTLDRSADKNGIAFVATLEPAKDIMLSSWAQLDCYALDFNLGLGLPESVRRPRFVPYESLMYLMPKSLDGEISVAICLRNEDLERLKADQEFAKYGKYIG